jgi:tetrapyrrole methylase family protein / MazG family protein
LITIIGLGPAGIDSMSAAALSTLESAEKPFLRTGFHPAAQELAARGFRFETFDCIYESASDFDEVYGSIAAHIIEEGKKRDVVYAVPGHPLCAERSVALIIDGAEKEGIQFRIVGSESFIDACLEALAAPLGKGLKLIDALEIDAIHPSTNCPNLIYQVYDRFVASNLKLALMNFYPDELEVYIIFGAGGDDSRVEKVPLYEMDRREFDHLTSVYVPELDPL